MLTAPQLSRPDVRTLSFLAAAGYGGREALARGDAAHHTGLGALAVAASAPWGLAGELRLDGRFEKHTARGDRGHGMVGELRGYLRYSHALSTNVALGAELGAWLPGAHAPSLRLSATTLDALIVLDARLRRVWSLVLAPGFRLDRSGRALPHPERLETGDFVTLGLSDTNAVLVRAGLSRAFARGQAFAEWRWDAHVGKGSGALAVSPLQVALGGRAALDRDQRWAVVVAARALVSQRQDVRRDAPLLPFPPRAELWCAVHYTLGALAAAPPAAAIEPPSSTSVAMPEPAPAASEPASVGPEPAPVETPRAPSGQLRLLVRDHRSGEALRAEVRVRAAAEPASEVSVHEPDAGGSLRLELPPGRYTVTIKLKGYRKQIKNVEIEDESVTMLDVGLHARSQR